MPRSRLRCYRDWHARKPPIRAGRCGWIVATAAGATTDIIARLMAQFLSERLGQPFIIENRPGGGSTIGTEAVVRAAPDGYTLLLVSAVNAINVTLFEKLNYDFCATSPRSPASSACRS